MLDILTFTQHPKLLNQSLWEKQKEVLEEFWRSQYNTGVWVLGRRCGKTFMASVSAIYAGVVMEPYYRRYLRQGEKFFIVTVANKEEQAKIALRNIKDLLNNSPELSALIIGETATSIELANGAVFKAIPSSSRSSRGFACPLLIMDEAGHFIDTDGNASGEQLYQALAPSIAQFGNLGRMLLLSSPFLKAGIFWKLYEDGRSGEHPNIQLAQHPTWEVNPLITQEFYDQQKALDPLKFQIEYGANFSDSLQTFIPNYLIDAALNHEREVLLPNRKYRGNYFLALDPAKGGRDDYVACIGHYENDKLVIDLWHEFKPVWFGDKKKEVMVEDVENWILQRHKEYGFKSVVFDQYNSQASIQRLRSKLRIEELTWTQVTKTEAYAEMKQLFTSYKIEIYNNKKAISQLRSLIVLYRTTGTWNVTGGEGVAVDDYMSALAGVVYISRPKSKSMWDVIL